MKVDVTRQSPATSIVTIGAIAALAMLSAESWSFAEPAAAMPLGELLTQKADGICGAAISFVLILFNGLMLSRICIRHMLFSQKSLFPAVMYAIAACGFFYDPASIQVYAASAFTVAGINILSNGFGRKADFDRCFRGSFLIGVSMLIYAPFAVMVVVTPLILVAIMRSVREYVVAWAGFLMPAAIYSYILWAMGGSFAEGAQQIVDILLTPVALPEGLQSVPGIVMISLLVLLIFLSVGSFAAMRYKMRTRPYRISLIFLAMLVVMLGAFGLPCRSVGMVQMAAIPFSVIAPFFFSHFTGRASMLTYLILLLAVGAVWLGSIFV